MATNSEDEHIQYQMSERPEITCSEWVEEWQRRIAGLERLKEVALWEIVSKSRHIERLQESVDAYKRAITTANSSTHRI